IDVHRRKADDLHAVVLVDDVHLRVVELVYVDLGAHRGHVSDARVRVPGIGLELLLDEMLHAVPGLGPRRAVALQRRGSASQPTADQDLGEVPDMVGVQMGSEIGGDLLIGDLQRAEVHLRAVAEVELELVAVAELDEPAGIGLGGAQERPSSAEGRDPHLVRPERLSAGEIAVPIGAHRPPRSPDDDCQHRKGDFDSDLMLICNNLISKSDHRGGPWYTFSAVMASSKSITFSFWWRWARPAA